MERHISPRLGGSRGPTPAELAQPWRNHEGESIAAAPTAPVSNAERSTTMEPVR